MFAAQLVVELPDLKTVPVKLGELRLPEDDHSLHILKTAVELLGKTSDRRLSDQIKAAMSQYYQSYTVSIDIVRRAIASAKVDIKEIPEGSVWKAKKLRGLAAGNQASCV